MRPHLRFLNWIANLGGVEGARLGERGVLLRNRGFDWPSHRRAFEQLQSDEELRLLIAEQAIDVLIDVGANSGQFAERFRSLGFAGSIVSFEPNPVEFENLRVTASSDAKWQVLPFALGESSGEATLNVTRASDFASILPMNMSIDEFNNEREILDTVVVRMLSLDDAWAAHVEPLQPRAIFLKVDTQGYDHHVFRGATRALTDVVALLFEVPFVPLYEGMIPYSKTLELLAEHGFAPAGLWPVSRAHDSLAMLEADVLMVNQRIGQTKSAHRTDAR